MRTTTIALSLAIAGIATAGCSGSIGPAQPVVTKDALAAEVSQLAEDMGGDVDRVVCQDDLVGAVGESTRCEIESSNPVFVLTPIVTVTSVDGETVNWEVEPTLTAEQLERQMTHRIGGGSGGAPDTVSCDEGLDGPAGNTTQCDVSIDGGPSQTRTVKAKKAEGLALQWSLLAMLPREQAEQSLHRQLTEALGYPPDSVECAGDLVGEKGNTTTCDVEAPPDSWVYLLTVESIEGEQIRYRYEPVA